MASQLEMLIGLWRETRAVEVSEAVERIDTGTPAPPYRPSWTSARKQEAWTQRARARRPADLPSLLATLHDAYSDDVRLRVRELLAWEPDPRIPSAFVRLVEKPAHHQRSTMPLWDTLADALVETADARTLARLDAVARLGPGWPLLFQPQMRVPISAWLTSTQKRVTAAVTRRPHRALSAQERASLGSNAGSIDTALQAVWANPGDVALRLVLADMLTAAGEPWGEFISLQCLAQQSPASRKRAAELLARSDGRWAGPLAPFVEVHEWAGGFPAAVTVRARTRRSLSTVVGHPAWSTIHTVQLTPVGFGRTPLEVVTHPSMTHLQRVAGLSDTDVRALLRQGRPLPFRSLVIGDDVRLLKSLTPERLPALAQVHVRGKVTELHRALLAQRGLEFSSGRFELTSWPWATGRNARQAPATAPRKSTPVEALARVQRGATVTLDGQDVRITRIAELGDLHFQRSSELRAWNAAAMESMRFSTPVPRTATVSAAFAGRDAVSLKLALGKTAVARWVAGPRIPEGADLLVLSANGVFEQIDTFVDDADELIDFAGDVLAKVTDPRAGVELVDLTVGDDDLELLVWRRAHFGATTWLGVDSRGALSALLLLANRAPR